MVQLDIQLTEHFTLRELCDSETARRQKLPNIPGPGHIMKLKNLLSGAASESVYKADEKFEVVVLERKEVTYSYFADPMYVFMDAEYNQYEVEADNMEDVLKYLEDGLQCEVVFYNGKAIAVELPTSVVREVTYTEPAVKGDTSGKVMKPAKIGTGFELMVPAFVEIGDKIEIDTRTNEYRNRVK